MTTVWSVLCPLQHFKEGTGMVLTLISEELHPSTFSRMFADDYPTENSSQGYCGDVTMKVRCGSEEQIKDGLLSQIVDEEDQNVFPFPNLYSTAVKMEESTGCLTQTECTALGSTPRTSSSDLSAAYGQNTELENTPDSEQEVFDEENSRSSCNSSQQRDSCEGETDSQHSDFVFGSNYEPRPDPRWMMSDQFRSQHWTMCAIFLTHSYMVLFLCSSSQPS